MVAVILCCDTMSKKVSGLKDDGTYKQPPRSKVGTRQVNPAWDKGVTTMNRTADGISHSAICIMVIYVIDA